MIEKTTSDSVKVNNRTLKAIQSGKKKSLAEAFPEIAKEWCYEKNGDLTPEMVTYSSHEKVWWQCTYGHKWPANISNRTNFNSGCPYCAGQKVLTGFNDLATIRPDIAAEWHPTKNADLTPEMVTSGSNNKVWWKGTCGHEWEAVVNSRVNQKQGCPFCSGHRILSGFNDLATKYPDIVTEWHPDKNGDLIPEMVAAKSGKKVWWLGKCGHEWKTTPANRVIHNSGCPYCAGKKVLLNFNDLATAHPEIASEWHPTKNGKLTPEMVTTGSSKKEIWWKCKYGHEWKSTVANRTRGNGCPYCAGKKVLPGFNDLMTQNPKLAKEWHPTKNGKLTPEMVTLKSGKKVWWQCEYGHEWPAKICTRTNGSNCPHCSPNGTSWPEQVLFFYTQKYIDKNALHRFQDYGKEIDVFIPKYKCVIEYDGYYHIHRIEEDKDKNKFFFNLGFKSYRIRENILPKLNDGISIDFYYKYGNHKKLSQLISNLIFVITNKKVTIDIDADSVKINNFIKRTKIKNSLAETHPALVSEWHPTKNGLLTPEMVSAGSVKKVWWQCEHGHEWQTTVNQRTSNKTKCPYCLGQKVWSGFNDLATTHPALVSEWHPDKNGDLSPYKISAGSSRKIEWKCSHCGHEYTRMVNAQTTSKYNARCPNCKTPVTAAKSA